MTREIKFRFWDEELKRMVDYATLASYGGDVNGWFAGTLYKVMQFTGLTDKAGKEIWEGDLIQWNDKIEQEINPGNGTVTGQVVYKDGGFYPFIGEYRALPNEVEIVGNIYEHSHLLSTK